MFGKTDIGKVRKNNQDSILYDERQFFGVVADGIGGRKGGEIASSIAVQAIKDEIQNSETIKFENIKEFMCKAVTTANSKILSYGQKNPAVAGMGTTLNCLFFVGETVFITHVGDSRTYLYYNDQLWQLTFDHNIENYVSKNWIDGNSIAPNSNMEALVRALGIQSSCIPDVYDMKVKPGSIFITCSDGLSGMISDGEMRSIIKHYKHDLEKLPNALVSAANKAGGKDNITVLVSEIGGAA